MENKPIITNSIPLHYNFQTGSSCKIGFKVLGESIIQSLSIGIIAFDKNLKIIEANCKAFEMFELCARIDETLAAGTDKQIWGDWKEKISAAISAGKECAFENVTYKLNDQPHLLQLACAPLTDSATNEIIGGILVAEDTTEKVQVQRQLATAERFAAVGKLASKIAHELNNPMDGILRYINLTIRHLDKENLEKPKEYLQQCRSGLMRMVQIISELLEFSRNTYSAFEFVPVEKLLDEAVKTMEPSAASANIIFERNYTEKFIPLIRSGNLFQVFCNLIKNAVDAMTDSQNRKITISTALRDDNILMISFQDTGPGFPPENTNAIFEPFFTTKSKGKGTGLGLAICKDIIEKYNGKITAENAPLCGSIFTVHLPLTSEISMLNTQTIQ